MTGGEFDIIERYFRPLASDHPELILGSGDDCTVIEVPKCYQLAHSIDSLVQGVHFTETTTPVDLAWRLLGASVSDLAAMGAEPRWLMLALSTPHQSEDWYQGFAQGLKEASDSYGVMLIGGDTCYSPQLVVTAQVQGVIPEGQLLSRSGAQLGDLIAVTGTLGDSRAGLALILDELEAVSPENKAYLTGRFYRPTPRISEGIKLRNAASAVIDLSDGLLADLNHLLKASGVAGVVDLDLLPLSQPFKETVSPANQKNWAATGGEDFELCFTIAPELLEELSVKATVIGRVEEGSGLSLCAGGAPVGLPSQLGFNHFGSSNG